MPWGLGGGHGDSAVAMRTWWWLWGLGGGPVMGTEGPQLPQPARRSCTDRFLCVWLLLRAPVEPPAVYDHLPRPLTQTRAHQRLWEVGGKGEVRGRGFKHCQVSATGGEQVQRQQELLKVFDLLPGGLPGACKCFKGGSPFRGHGNVSKEPQSVQCFKDLCSLKIPP